LSRQFGAWFRSHRRPVVGAILSLAILAILVSFTAELDNAYRSVLTLHDRGAPVFYFWFVTLMIIGCLTSLIPASVLGIFAGATFGVAEGFAISAGSFLAAALIAFSFGRFFFRDASRWIAGQVINLDKLEANLAVHSWRYALLLRLTPIAPFGITSYALGLTPIKLDEYLLTTLGAFPFLLVCVYAGRAGGIVIGQHGEFDRDALWKLALLFTIGAVLVAITMWCANRLRRRVEPAP
jgi:uncharacterized membrane protein YdjX (TVP38/TMEM64 family)